MKQLLTVLTAAALAAGALPAHAQNAVPAPAPAQDQPIWLVPEQTQKAESAADTLIRLQTGLYNLVAGFDDQADLFEKYVDDVEIAQMKEHIEKLTTPGGPKNYQAPPKTFEQQVQYNAVAAEPTMCNTLDAMLGQYVLDNTPELDAAVTQLTKEADAMDETQKADAAMRFKTAVNAIKTKKRAQEIIAWCIYKKNNEAGVPCWYSVEKTLRTWFRIQKPLVDAWLGNTD